MQEGKHLPRRRTFLKTSGLVLGSMGFAGCTGGPDDATATDTPTASGGGGTTTQTRSEEERLMEEADPPDPLVVTNFPIKPNYALLYAEKNGFFEKRGINFQWTKQPIFGGSNNFSAVISGNAHIASGSAAPGAINLIRNRDVTMKLVWPQLVNDLGDDYNSGDFLVAHTDFETIPSLEGETIVTHSGGPGLVIIGAKWNLEQAGLNPNVDVDIRQVPLPNLGGTINQKDAAGGVMLEPAIMAAIDEGFDIHRLAPAYGWLETGVLVGAWTSSEFAQNHSATLQLFQRAMREASEVMRTDPDKIAAEVGASDIMAVSEDLVSRLLEKKDLGRPVESVAASNPLASFKRIDELLWKFAPQVIDRVPEDRLQEIVLPWNR